MEVINSTTTAVPATNQTYKHSHSHSHSNNDFPSKTILISITLLTSLTLFFAIFLVAFMLRRLKSKHNDDISTTLPFASSSPEVKGGCVDHHHPTPTTPNKFRGVQVLTYREIEVATGGMSEGNVIGNGDSGLVYKGILSDGTLAAIKLMQREGKQEERAFRIEVDILSRLHCPYLVELLGYCADQHHRVLVFEYMPNGTLYHHLHSLNYNNQSQPLDWWTRMRIALDCAMALEFLHEHALSPVIHRDFKTANVLLDQNFRAKVSHFGLAKTGSDKINGQISTRVLGTTGYLAPEYASTGKLTTKSDVYSYGVVLLEVLTGRVPVDIERPPGEHALPRLTNREKVVEMVDPALRGQYSKKDLIQVAAIAAMCIQTEADYRPLMTDIVQSLIPLVRNPSSSSVTSSSSSLRFLKSPTY
ncbi:probable serine/threonine-protein kinase PBL7 isoform X3 [Arachis ipaensis]|uniref:probable serine/threonine-protein kinase PBL7 isoform X3 n=1 Tax=Arachis ipaensis TaxID=130454 RepID=UPI000A2B1059|nr:probable serine/threonine-protein kinase PBL7 isoform X3 [Arachis ipaensis]